MLKYAFDTSNSTFFKLLKTKVDRYFVDKHLDVAGNKKLYIKGAVQVSLAIILYTTLVFFTPGPLISLPLCVILGIDLALMGFNIMHEGGHQTFSRHPWMNTVSAHFLNILGGTAYFWKIKHNINHHTYTNIEGMDSDIDVKPFMRLHDGQPYHTYHRFQHIYWVALYGLSYISWVFYEDFLKYFSGRFSANSERKKLSTKEHFVFWFTKISYVLVYIVVPIIFAGWAYCLIGFLVITFVCGLAISIVFQLAHVVEGTSFHQPKDGSGTEEWAIHQINSTANFGTSSKMLHWLLGGLNFQIEHHLFPRVSHIHYPALSRLVKESCRESNVKYNEYSSMFTALVSHLIHLRHLGKAQIL